MPSTIAHSRFWPDLWARYHASPSATLCRVPELEYASTLPVEGDVLDHCCGDGQFAAFAWPGSALSAGCDFNDQSLAQAKVQGMHGRLDSCDASKRLPYEDGSFDLVFDNSALEHIEELDAALAEVARVLRPEGVFAFNVLNHRYFEWWPLDDAARADYQKWQPFHHALCLDEWSERLANAGLVVTDVAGYFDKPAAQDLARLDYAFTCFYIGKTHSRLVEWYRRLPRLMEGYWRRRLAKHVWRTEPDSGAGYFIKAAPRCELGRHLESAGTCW